MEVGLAFLPGNVIMGMLSIGRSATLVMRSGIRAPLAAGLGLPRPTSCLPVSDHCAARIGPSRQNCKPSAAPGNDHGEQSDAVVA